MSLWRKLALDAEQDLQLKSQQLKALGMSMPPKRSLRSEQQKLGKFISKCCCLKCKLKVILGQDVFDKSNETQVQNERKTNFKSKQTIKRDSHKRDSGRIWEDGEKKWFWLKLWKGRAIFEWVTKDQKVILNDSLRSNNSLPSDVS